MEWQLFEESLLRNEIPIFEKSRVRRKQEAELLRTGSSFRANIPNNPLFYIPKSLKESTRTKFTAIR